MTPPDIYFGQASSDFWIDAGLGFGPSTPTADSLLVLNRQLQYLGNGLGDVARGLVGFSQGVHDSLKAIQADLQDLQAQQLKAQLPASGLARREAPLHVSFRQ